MPVGDKKAAGRDHGPDGFSLWMACDPATWRHRRHRTQAAENSEDFHATLLHLRSDWSIPLDERLTDQYPARVVNEILA